MEFQGTGMNQNVHTLCGELCHETWQETRFFLVVKLAFQSASTSVAKKGDATIARRQWAKETQTYLSRRQLRQFQPE